MAREAEMSTLQVKPRTPSANIFINYRREDSAGHAGRLFDGLSDHFAGRLFMDVDTLEPGVDFVDAIEQAVGSCEALIVVIGRQWLTIQDKAGRRRLDDPADFVRLELESALARKIRVIPVLVQDAPMPRAEELPPSLARLARRNAIELSDARWAYDVDRLAQTIQEVLEQDGISVRPQAAAPAKALPLLAPPELSVGAAGSKSRAWLISLAALLLVAAVGLVSLAWLRRDPNAGPDLAAVQPADRTGVMVAGVGAALPTPVPSQPAVSPLADASNGNGVPTAAGNQPPTGGLSTGEPPAAATVPPSVATVVAAANQGLDLVDRLQSAATNRGGERVKPVATVPAATPVGKAEGGTVPSSGETSTPSTAAESQSTPASVASSRPARVTILSPRSGEVVGPDVVVQGVVFGLVSQQMFLGIRQKNGSIYPRGELFPNADGQWTIKLRSSKEKTFDVLVVTSTSQEATQVLRDQRSRDDGLSVLPEGASISSGIVTLRRQGRIVGILNPKAAEPDR
jgi:TIR domain-containing protein